MYAGVNAKSYDGNLNGSDDQEWQVGKLETGEQYWWRVSAIDGNSPEVSLTEPKGAWKYDVTSTGQAYLWRVDPAGEPEVRLWKHGTLGSGQPYWWVLQNIYTDEATDHVVIENMPEPMSLLTPRSGGGHLKATCKK